MAIPNLQWTPLDHCEIFSGKMSVTLGELEVGLAKQLLVLRIKKHCFPYVERF